MFFAPLGLGSTGGCASERIMAATNRAVGYELVGGSFQVRPLSTTKANAFVGAGGLCSNATDLVQWMRGLIDGKVLSPPLRLRYQGAHEFATPEPSARSFRFEPAAG